MPWSRRPSRTAATGPPRPAPVVVAAASVAALVAAFLILLAVTDGPSAKATLNAPQAIVLGAVEGITEFLPISSTGHLVVTERLFGLGGNAASLETLDSYAVIIQGGAILAVLVLFWRRLIGSALALGGMLRLPGFRREPAEADRRVALAIVLASVPAGLIGVVIGDTLQEHLFSPGPIAVAWAVGGLALLAAAGWLHRRGQAGEAAGFSLEQLTWRHALLVGLAQSLALWPGVSRSLVTIVAGCLVGMTLAAAVEFSFLVGFVVLLAATGLELLKHGNEIIDAYGLLNPALGLVVAFVSAVAAIRWLLNIIGGRSLAGFGWYRLAAAVLTFALLAADRV